MAMQLEIQRLRIEAPEEWSGREDAFGNMLEIALREEMQRIFNTDGVDDHQILRVNIPPVTVSDMYDMQETAREIARRIAQAIRQNPARSLGYVQTPTEKS